MVLDGTPNLEEIRVANFRTEKLQLTRSAASFSSEYTLTMLSSDAILEPVKVPLISMIDLASPLILLVAPTGRVVLLVNKILATMSSMSCVLVHRCGQPKKICA